MIALEFPKVKESMTKLLLTESFDSFLFLSAEIVTFNTFTIDGFLKKDFYDADEAPQREYSLWKDVREHCFSVIKGQRTPLRFSFVLGLPKENIQKLLEQQGFSYTTNDVKGLYLNIRFDGERLICTTGTSMNLFSMDKTLGHTWDKMVQKFLQQKEIVFEEIG